jgi:hypothetical protein
MIRFPAISAVCVFAFMLAIACGGAAAAGDVQVEAFVTTSPSEPPLDVLPADAAKLYVIFKTHGITRGDKFRGVLIVDRAGRIAPENSTAKEGTATLEGDTSDGAISFTRPINGWPPGDYHVDIYINDQLRTTVKFKFEIPKSAAASEAKP